MADDEQQLVKFDESAPAKESVLVTDTPYNYSETRIGSTLFDSRHETVPSFNFQPDNIDRYFTSPDGMKHVKRINSIGKVIYQQ